MKVAIYVRVSTQDQSTEMQRLELYEFVSARGWTIFKVYEDHGVSGSKSSRPALNQMMADAKARKFKAVLVWKFDRFARSTKHLVTALDELTEYDVQFVSLKESVDTTTSSGKAFFGMISVMAQFERDMIRERVVAGLRNAKAKGKKLGPKVRLDPERIRKMYFQEDRSMAQIAKELKCSVGAVHKAIAVGSGKYVL